MPLLQLNAYHLNFSAIHDVKIGDHCGTSSFLGCYPKKKIFYDADSEIPTQLKGSLKKGMQINRPLGPFKAIMIMEKIRNEENNVEC